MRAILVFQAITPRSASRSSLSFSRPIVSLAILISHTIVLLVWPAPCFAQQTLPQAPRTARAAEQLEQEALYLKEETVVTAIRQEQPISQAPSNVYVITDEDIRLSGATDVPTLLRRVPGMEVSQLTAADYAVSVRGDNQARANKLLVLVDGRSVYVDLQGTVPWTQLPVTLAEIKRIEVLKGPASAIYGFNAFDGVVHIITKSPEEMKGTTLQAGYGEYGTVRSAAVQAGRHGKLGYRLSVGEDQQQQWENRHALSYRSYRFNLHTDYELSNESSLHLNGGVVDTNRLQSGAGEILNVNSPSDIAYTELVYKRADGFVRLNWNLYDARTSNSTVPVLAPFITTTDRNGNTGGIPFVGNTYNAEGQYSLALSQFNRLIGGLNYRLNTLNSTEVTGNPYENRFGMYLQDEWRLAETLTLNAGMRIDMHTRTNPTYSPRIALLYNPVPDHQFRISGSLGYRTPTLVENFSDVRTTFNIFGFLNTVTLIGNTHLVPEQIISYEAEYQGWYFKHRLRLRVAAFANYVSDLIGPVDIGPTQATYVNQGKADIFGGEAGFEFLATTWMTAFANVAYQGIDQSNTGNLRRGGPHVKINGGLQGRWQNGVNGEIIVHYVSPTAYPVLSVFSQLTQIGLIPPGAAPSEQVNSYTLLNMRGGYRFWHDKAEVAIAAFNALNDRHREMPQGEVIGSRVMGWFTLRM